MTAIQGIEWGYTTNCLRCGRLLNVAEICSCYSTYQPIPNIIPNTIGVSNILKHINWQVYTPANPPELDIEHLVAFISPETGERDWGRAILKKKEDHQLEWIDPEEDVDISEITITHYAKLELP